MLTKVLSPVPELARNVQNNQSMPRLVWDKRDGLTAVLLHDTQQQLVCPNCDETYFAGQLTCSNCGILLNSVGKTRQLRAFDITETLRQMPPADQYADAPPHVSLEIAGQYLALPAQPEFVLGRLRGVAMDLQPDIDLNRFGADEYGVSRHHVRFSRRDDKLYLTDLGSSNGTFVNGRVLPPNRRRQIHDGDELQLGYLRLKVRFQP